MNKQKKLIPKGDYIFFVDIEDESDLYCLTQKEYNANRIVIEKIMFEPDPEPNDDFVKVFKLEKVKEDARFDYYDIIDKEPIDYRTSRIKFIPVNS